MPLKRASVFAFALLATAGGSIRAAHAQTAKAMCAEEHLRAQSLRSESKWLEARKVLTRCVRPACPPAIVADCDTWASELASRQPSVVVVAKDPSGGDTVDVKLSIDGTPLASQVGTTAIELDPGEHVLRLEHAGWEPVETRVIMREGERSRPVAVKFTSVKGTRADAPSPSPAPAPSPVAIPSRSIPTAAWIFGGVGLVAGVVGGALDVTTWLDKSDCSGKCTQADADSFNRRYLVGDLFIAGGVALAVTALVLIVTSRPSDRAALSSPTPLRVRF